MENIQNNTTLQPSLAEPPKQKSSHLPFILLSLLLIISLTAVAYLFLQVQSLNRQLSNIKDGAITAEPTLIPTASVTSTTSSLKIFTDKYDFGSNVTDVFKEISKDYGGAVNSTNAGSLWWVSNDGYNIINDNEISLEYQKYDCVSDTNDQPVFKNIAEGLSAKIKSVMESSGFVLNQKNSSKTVADTQFYDYVQAYEKGSLKCALIADPDCGGSRPNDNMHYTYSFVCTDSFTDNYQKQLPYLKGLGISGAIIRVSRTSGNFAVVSVNYRRTGHYVIAKLTDGKWKSVYAGQDAPSCKAMNEYQVPKEIYGQCYSEEDTLQ